MNNYKLIQGDCFQVLPTLDDNSIDLILTDPPYNILTKEDITVEKTRLVRKEGFDHKKLDISFLITEFSRILKDGGAFYIFCSDRQLGDYISEIEKAGLIYSKFLVWYQTTGFPSVRKRMFQSHCQLIVFGHKEINEKYIFNFKSSPKMRDLLHFDGATSFEYKGGTPGEYLGHPTQKPSKLFKHLIEVSSNRGDVILDPFMGSGTTMLACQDLGRSCVGIELDEKYFEMTKKRCFHRRFLDREVDYELRTSCQRTETE